MNLKRAMLERIERDSIKVEVDGETIYLKKKSGWHVIYPPVDIKSVEKATDENGNVDWNKVKWDRVALFFGSKSNAIKTAIVGVITILIAFGAWQLISSFNTIVSNPIVQSCLDKAGITISAI